MSNNKKIILVFALFLALSGAAGFMIYRYLNPQRTTIYVFNNSYAAGTPLTEGMLTPMQADSTIVLNSRRAGTALQFVTNADYQTVIQSGDALRMDVGQGTPLMFSMLSVTGGSPVEMSMKPSSIAVTIPVSNITGITPDIRNGSKVNIYLSMNNTTTLLMENMRILSLQKKDGALSGATIECDIDQSLILINSATYGSIYLGLVDGNGYQYSEVENPNFLNFIGSQGQHVQNKAPEYFLC